MSDVTILFGGNGRPTHRSLLQRIGDRLFAEDDAFAREHGWRTTETWWGLGRMYRSPFFDNFSRCSTCRGSGLSPVRLACCDCCGGTGRIDHRLDPVSDEGAGPAVHDSVDHGVDTVVDHDTVRAG